MSNDREEYELIDVLNHVTASLCCMLPPEDVERINQLHKNWAFVEVVHGLTTGDLVLATIEMFQIAVERHGTAQIKREMGMV